MRLLSVCFILLILSSVFAAEKFDIATFTAPEGWTRGQGQGYITFSDGDPNKEFANILLLVSQQSSGDPQKDFDLAWNELIVKPSGLTVKPQIQKETSPDGWLTLTGVAKISDQTRQLTILLLSASRSGKVFDALVKFSGDRYQAPIEKFFTALDLSDAQAAPQQSAAGSLTDYVFDTPEGWTGNSYPDGIVLLSPMYSNGEQCNLSLWPMHPTSGNLQQDAGAAFSKVFSSFQVVQGDATPSIVQGTSGDGWPYLIIRTNVQHPGGNYAVLNVRLMAIQLNNQVAIISSIGKQPLISNCLGELISDAWPKFFYSLQFKNWTPKQPSLPLAGTWISATATAGDRIVFAPNGRYQGAAAHQSYEYAGNNEVLTKTEAYFGDGSYSVKGNRITFVEDKTRRSRTGFMRLEQESTDGGRTWTEKLYILRKSDVDGKDYEIAYKREK